MDWKWLEAMDLTWHIEGMHARANFVTTRLRVTGTHQGEILGLEPTGNAFEISALTLRLIDDGKIIEWSGEWDFAGLLDQIEAIDSPIYDEEPRSLHPRRIIFADQTDSGLGAAIPNR